MKRALCSELYCIQPTPGNPNCNATGRTNRLLPETGTGYRRMDRKNMKTTKGLSEWTNKQRLSGFWPCLCFQTVVRYFSTREEVQQTRRLRKTPSQRCPAL